MIDRKSALRMWALLDRRSRWQLGGLVGLAIVAALASAAMLASIFPFLAVLSAPCLIERNAVLAHLYAWMRPERHFDFVMALGWFVIGVVLSANAVLFLHRFLLVQFNARQSFRLSRMLLTRFLAQPYAFSLDRHTGNLSSGVLNEAQQAVNQFLRPMLTLVSAALTLLAVSATVIALEPVAGLAVFGLFAVFYGSAVLITRRRVRQYGERRARANRARYRIVSEAMSGLKEIKLLGLEARYAGRYDGPAREMENLIRKMQIISTTPRYIVQSLFFCGVVLLCLSYIRPSPDGGVIVGPILPVLGLLAFAAQRLMPAVTQVFTELTQLRFGAAAVDRLWEDVEATGAAALPLGAPAEPLGLSRTLELRDVSYVYPHADARGLDGVSLTIRAGERVGIVGRTGAGKTTLADVVLGLLEPQAGEIRVDGTPLDAETMRAWRRSVGYVQQDIFLIDDTISANIALGLTRPQIDEARVEACAKAARLHEFIMHELPQRYQTETGERGVRLSGGQRQRIGIARALYHGADLIVLDEATSALDTVTERAVVDAIEALPGTKTVLMIAHRLTTLRRCDRIVMMERGRIEATGTWEELVATNPSFREFVRAGAIAPLEAVG